MTDVSRLKFYVQILKVSVWVFNVSGKRKREIKSGLYFVHIDCWTLLQVILRAKINITGQHNLYVWPGKHN